MGDVSIAYKMSGGVSMARRVTLTEANKGGSIAVVMGKRGSLHTRSQHAASAPVLRMPSNYSERDVEVLLSALWNMFTETQARKVRVTVPWDDSEDAPLMTVTELATLLEGWLS
jgi:hypothetical protein